MQTAIIFTIVFAFLCRCCYVAFNASHGILSQSLAVLCMIVFGVLAFGCLVFAVTTFVMRSLVP